MQVKPISAPPVNESAEPVRFDVSDVLADFTDGTPSVALGMTALLSEDELTAALFTGFSGPDELDGLSPEQVREYVAFSIAWEGMAKVSRALEMIRAGRLNAATAAYEMVCRAMVRQAFGLGGAQ